MSEDQSGPPNPNREQQLFEKLSMSVEDLKYLNFIRRHVKLIIKSEQNGRTEKAKP